MLVCGESWAVAGGLRRNGWQAVAVAVAVAVAGMGWVAVLSGVVWG